jgi:hypothetical protein
VDKGRADLTIFTTGQGWRLDLALNADPLWPESHCSSNVIPM